MQPDIPPGTPQDWLSRARGKLAVAQPPLPEGGYWEDLCYMLQQAAELAIKAVYLQHGWRFAFTHDLGQLLDTLEKKGIAIPLDVQNADQMTVYATQTRYPGITPPVTQEHYAQAAVIATGVVRWASSAVEAETGEV